MTLVILLLFEVLSGNQGDIVGARAIMQDEERMERWAILHTTKRLVSQVGKGGSSVILCLQS